MQYKAHLNDQYGLERILFSQEDRLNFDEDGESFSYAKLNVSKYEDGNRSVASNGFHRGATPFVIGILEFEDVFGGPSRELCWWFFVSGLRMSTS